MHKFSRKRRLGEHYIRYLISYIAVLLIPLVILTFFYSSRFMKKFYEEIYETVDLELLQTGTQMDNELESMDNIVGQLTLTGMVHQAVTARSPLDLSPVITYLSGFSLANPFIEDIVLAPDDIDYIATSTTTCQKDYYFSRIFQVPGYSTESWNHLLSTSTAPSCIPEQKLVNLDFSSSKEDMVLFTYPLFTDYQKHVGTTLFYVKSTSMRTLFSQKLQSYDAQIYILDANGQIIITSGANDRMRPVLSEWQKSQVPASFVQVEGDEYVVRSHTSQDNGWSYVAFIPDRQTTFSQVNTIMRDFLFAIVIILILSSFAIFFLQKVNYAPVRRLRDQAKKLSPDQSSTDELATIANALDYLSTQNTALSSQLADSLTAVKNERLYRLLDGAYASREEFNLDCSELDLYLPEDYYAVGILLLHTPAEVPGDLAQEIKKLFDLPGVYYYLHSIHSNQIALLLNLPDEKTALQPAFRQVQDHLLQNYNLTATIGIGSVSAGTKGIPGSYMEAASALDYRFVKGNGTVIEFKEVLGPQNASMVYPNQEFETLRNTLLSQNEDNIRSAIQNIISFMEQGQLPLYLARSICFDLIHLVNDHCLSLNNRTGNSPIELSGMETAREIIQMLHAWSSHLNNLTPPSSEKVQLEDVLEFLNGNCLRCDFSALEAAEQFRMSLPSFSKFFKDHTGQNVMDFTIQLRIRRAKELLRSTDLPLKDIAEQVGYYNISSFTRRFKLNQGITPSDYRKTSENKK